MPFSRMSMGNKTLELRVGKFVFPPTALVDVVASSAASLNGRVARRRSNSQSLPQCVCSYSQAPILTVQTALRQRRHEVISGVLLARSGRRHGFVAGVVVV